MVSVPSWLPLVELAVVAALLAFLLGLWRLDRTREWGRRRRARLLLGLPWGTIVSVLGVLSVYLFVQGGFAHWNDPLTLPFRAWSYFYPLGMSLAPFSHNGPGHLVGNLTSALVFAPIAEYAWGHFATERGEVSFSSPTRNPYVRAFLLVPAGVVVVGLLTSLFSWGPIIGFSGVVFAFVGFALVRYPYLTVAAVVVENFVGLVVAVLRNPVITREARPQYVTPWWAGVAVQGHLLGLFLGIVVAAIVLDRSERPPARRLLVGSALVAAWYSLWVLWWYRGGERYVLYQGWGLVLVVALAGLITLGLHARWSEATVSDLPWRHVGLLVLLFPILVVGFAAVVPNLATVADPSPPGEGDPIEVGDYTVTYAENVTNEMVSVVNVSVLGESTNVRTSGVIVISEDRHIWSQSLSRGRLAFAGRGHVVVGGVGWRESVDAARRGWVATGNGTTYVIYLRPPDGEWRVAYQAEPVVAEPVVDGARVAVLPRDGRFALEVRRNGSAVGSAPIPQANATVTLGGVTLVRENASVFATVEDTRVRVAKQETYQG